MNDDARDDDRARVLDRIEERLPEIDLDQHKVEWAKLPDGHQALLLDGGAIDGGDGSFIANAGDDLHVLGLIGGDTEHQRCLGCVVVKADGSRYLSDKIITDPLAES